MRVELRGNRKPAQSGREGAEANSSRQRAARLCPRRLGHPEPLPAVQCAPQDLSGHQHPTTIPGTGRAEQHPHTSGFRLLTRRTEFPVPARPGMAMRPAAAAAAAEGMARGASAPWTLGTERPAREGSVDVSLEGCAKRGQARSLVPHTATRCHLAVACTEATHTARHRGQSGCVQTACARQHKSSD